MKKWIKVRLDDVAQVIMGQSPDSVYYNTQGLGVPFLQGSADFGKKYPDGTIFCSKPTRIAPKGSILFSVRAPVGDTNVADKPYCIGRGVAALIPNAIDPTLLLYQVSSLKSEFDRLAQGSTFTAINSSELRGLRFNVPTDEPEQSAIARILSTVDKAIEKTEQLIAKYERIKTGLMQDLLTKGIDEQGRIRSESTHRFKDSPLGRIPQEWEVMSIGEMAEHVKSGITPTGGSKVYQQSGIMLIRSQNVLSGRFDLSDVAFISEEINEQMKRSEVSEFDVLLNITGASIGRSYFVPKNFPKANVNQHVCAIRCRQKTEGKAIFVSSYLNSAYGQNQIVVLNAGSNREGLNYQQVKEIRLPNPKDDTEFIRIAEAVKTQTRMIDGLDSRLKKLRSIKQGLLQDLLSGRVRVTQEMIEQMQKETEMAPR